MTLQIDKPLLDPYDYDFHEDPYPYYKRLRDEAPLYRNEELGFWALSRHADVHQGFRNTTTLSNKYGVSLDPASRGPHAAKTMSFLAMDDPAHLRLRTLVSKGFTPRRIRELEPRVTEIAHAAPRHHAGEGGHGAVDYVNEFAGKLPMDVISELMGVPEPDRDQVRAWADGVMHRDEGVTDVPAAAVEASINLIVYYQQMVAERREKPTDDLTTALLEAEIDGDRLTDDEILGFMFLMVIAGNETTTKLLANAAFWGHRNPDQLTSCVRRPYAGAVVGGGDAALRHVQSDPGPHRGRRAHPLRHHDSRRRDPAAAARFRAPRRAGVRESRRLSSSAATSVPNY